MVFITSFTSILPVNQKNLFVISFLIKAKLHLSSFFFLSLLPALLHLRHHPHLVRHPSPYPPNLHHLSLCLLSLHPPLRLHLLRRHLLRQLASSITTIMVYLIVESNLWLEHSISLVAEQLLHHLLHLHRLLHQEHHSLLIKLIYF